MGFKRILIALDNDPISAHAVDVGAELGQRLGAELALIHVIPGISGNDIGISPAEFTNLAKVEGQALLDGARQRPSLITSVLTFLESGDPVDRIVSTATNWPADCIVVGSHGRRGLDRVVLGSVAEAVLRNAPCPVLVVRAKK